MERDFKIQSSVSQKRFHIVQEAPIGTLAFPTLDCLSILNQKTLQQSHFGSRNQHTHS